VFGLAGPRDSGPRGLQTSHVGPVIGDQAAQKRGTRGNRVASALYLGRNRIGRERLAGAVESDRLREVKPRDVRPARIGRAAHQFGLDVTRGDQGGRRLTGAQLCDRQVEAEIANRPGIVPLAGTSERLPKLLHGLLRPIQGESRLA